MNKETPLKDLLPGAMVILHSGSYNPPRPVKIDRVTDTQIIIGDSRYRRESGYKAGEVSGFSRPWISIPKPGEIEKCRDDYRKLMLAGELRDVKWGKLPLATLEAVAALIPQPD